MELRDYIRALKRRWRTIAVSVLLLIGIAAGLTVTTPRTYQASTEVFVSLRDGSGGSTGAYQGNLFSQDRVKSYAQIVGSPAVTAPVIERLGLPLSPQELGDRIAATVPTGTVLVDIVVSDPVPADARQVADAVAAQFAKVVGDLERGSAKSSPVTVTVVRPAELPAAPTSPRPVLNIAVGLLLGLAIGVGAAIVREILDTSVKSVEDLRSLSGAPSLGEIGFDARAPESPLVNDDGTSTARLESFRTLRTNLRFVDVDNPPRVVVVTGPLQAEGKSTTAANLALALAEAGIRVALVEGDLRRPSVADYLGLEGAVGLTDVLVGRQELLTVLQRWGTVPLVVLPSGPIPPNPSELLGSAAMKTVLDQLRTMVDIVVVDAPPLLPVTDAAVLAKESDGAILVVRYGRTTREQVSRAVAALSTVNARTLGTVLTMVPQRVSRSGYYSQTYYAAAADRPKLAAVEPVGSAASGAHEPATSGRAASRRTRRRAG